MDANKQTADEIRSFEMPRLRELENEIRAELTSMRMDVYQSAATNGAKKRTLTKNLARVLTVKNEKMRASASK